MEEQDERWAKNSLNNEYCYNQLKIRSLQWASGIIYEVLYRVMGYRRQIYRLGTFFLRIEPTLRRRTSVLFIRIPCDHRKALRIYSLIL